MSYAQQLPGLIGVQDQNGGKGALIAAGGLYGIFIAGQHGERRLDQRRPAMPIHPRARTSALARC